MNSEHDTDFTHPPNAGDGYVGVHPRRWWSSWTEITLALKMEHEKYELCVSRWKIIHNTGVSRVLDIAVFLAAW